MIERAAAILNLSKRTQFDFEGWANRLTEQLCQPQVRIVDNDPPYDSVTAEEFLAAQNQKAQVVPHELNHEDVLALREAVRLGGSLAPTARPKAPPGFSAPKQLARRALLL